MKLLEGVKVLDLTFYAYGPSCGAVLADWGADVIHIEDITGDPTRGLLAVGGSYLPKGKISWPFEFSNRGKRSLALNLRKERGKEIAYKLVEKADVFLSNFLGDSLGRLGMSYEVLSKINPKLIYAHGNGYGEKGKEKEKPGYDHSAFWARSGIMATLGEPGETPTVNLPSMGDVMSGLVLAGAIGTALYAREKIGKGQKVSLALLGGAIWMTSWEVQAKLSTNEEYPRISRKRALNPIWNHYKAKDGKWIGIYCQPSEKYWDSFCKAIDREDITNDSRFNTRENREHNNKELISVLDEILLMKTRDEWGKVFDETGVISACAQTYSEVVKDPQVLANDYIVDVDHPVFGKIKLVRSPLDFSETPAKIEKSAPGFAQHDEEILLELGYSWKQIQAFKTERVIV